MTITTESARSKIESMCIESDMVAVRPFVAGTGCSGMTHSLTFADQRLGEGFLGIHLEGGGCSGMYQIKLSPTTF